MSKNLYIPRTLIFSTRNTKQLQNVDMDSISDKTIHMMKNHSHKLKLKVSTENDGSGKINVLPLSLYEEGSHYHIIFNKAVTVENGQKLDKNVHLAFRIENAKIALAKADNNNFVSQSDDSLKLASYNKYDYIAKEIINPKADDLNSESDNTQKKRKKYLLPILLLPVFIFMVSMLSKQITKANLIKDALEIGSSTQFLAGAVISKKDVELEPKDFYIRHRSNRSTTTLDIWDFAYEDGDAIQIFVNNEPITEEIVLLNEPIQIDVPTVGTVEVRGIFDGGGGITYAVFCELDGTTYFNDAPIDGGNKYIFQRRYF